MKQDIVQIVLSDGVLVLEKQLEDRGLSVLLPIQKVKQPNYCHFEILEPVEGHHSIGLVINRCYILIGLLTNFAVNDLSNYLHYFLERRLLLKLVHPCEKALDFIFKSTLILLVGLKVGLVVLDHEAHELATLLPRQPTSIAHGVILLVHSKLKCKVYKYLSLNPILFII